jgi:hypothetical protein
MKSTNMGCEVSEDELEFRALFPHVALGGKDDVNHACLRLCEPFAHGKPYAVENPAILPEGQTEMLVLSTHEGRRTGDFDPTRQQHRLRVTLTEGFELLDELQE